MHYAHTTIEHGGLRYVAGDPLPDHVPGLDALVEQGAAGPTRPEQNVVINTDGIVIRVVDEDGVTTRPAGGYVKRYEGDVTPEDIKNPDVDTPLLGVHRNEIEHRAQEPDAYDAGLGED